MTQKAYTGFGRKTATFASADGMPDIPVEAIEFNLNVAPETNIRVWRDVPSYFDLFLLADGATALTGATLVGGVQTPVVGSTLAVASVTTGDEDTSSIEITAHGKATGHGPIFISSAGGSVPEGCTEEQEYYLIVVDANNVRLATSPGDALRGVGVAISSVGSGTLTMQPNEGLIQATQQLNQLSQGSEDTFDLIWCDLQKLGVDGDGAINLDTDLGYVKRVIHVPQVRYYSVKATLGTSRDVSFAMTPE